MRIHIQQFQTTLTRSFKVCSNVLTAEPTSFVGANGAGGGGPHVLGVDYLDGDGVAREREEALEVDVARLCVVQDDLPHVLLGAAGVLVVLPVGKALLIKIGSGKVLRFFKIRLSIKNYH